MSDLRGLSRGSKTAAVVVVVVLLQVIVVAVLGLGTIARDREEGLRQLRQEARSRAQALALATKQRTRDGVLGALTQAAGIARGPGGLANIPRDTWLKAFREFYLVEASGRIKSAGGTVLHVPPEVIAAEVER